MILLGKNAFEHGGKWLAALKNWDEEKGKLLDFSANINPCGVAESVKAAIEAAMPSIVHYPDSEAVELKQAISLHYQVAQETILLGNGAVELLYLLCQYKRPQRILVPAPTFSEYERAARASGATVEYLPLKAAQQFALTFSELQKQLSQADMIFICNPNNPTGRLTERNEIRKILEAVKGSECLVVVDESFIDFVDNAEKYSCRSLLTDYPQLCILHSLTKFYAIPGLRLGFMLGTPRLTAALELRKDPWNVNTLAQSAGVAGLHDEAYQVTSRRYVAKEREKLSADLNAIPGLVVYPGAANFLLLDINALKMTATEFVRRMAENGVLVRNCTNYPGLTEDYVRVAVRSREENQRLITSIRQVV